MTMRAVGSKEAVLLAGGEPVLTREQQVRLISIAAVSLQPIGDIVPADDGVFAVPTGSFQIDGVFDWAKALPFEGSVPRRVTVILRPKEPRRIKKLRQKIDTGRPLGRRERIAAGMLPPRSVSFDGTFDDLDVSEGVDETGEPILTCAVKLRPTGLFRFR